MYGGVLLEVSPSDVTIEGDGSITLAVHPDGLRVCQILYPVDQHTGVGTAPFQGTKLHHGNEPAKVMNFSLRILSMYHSRDIKQLSSLQREFHTKTKQKNKPAIEHKRFVYM